MRFVKDLSKGILGRPDDYNLWVEIIHQIPDSVLLNPDVKICNVACGHLTEAIILCNRMIALGVDKETVLNSIYINDKYRTFTNRARRLGFRHIITADFLKWDPNMKFNVVIGNPPYTRSVWKQFLKKFINLSEEIVAIICPDPTLGYTEDSEKIRNLLLDNGIFFRKECSDSFKEVNLELITYFICNKNSKADAAIFDRGGLQAKIAEKVLPHRETHGKLLITHGGTETAAFKENSVPLGKNKIPVFESVKLPNTANVIYMEAEDGAVLKRDNHILEGRVLITNKYFAVGQNSPLIEIENAEEYGFGVNLTIIKMEVGETLEAYRSLYLSKLYVFLLRMIRSGAEWNRYTFIELLPKLDLSRVWTDQELYDYFGIKDKEEIDCIEAPIK